MAQEILSTKSRSSQVAGRGIKSTQDFMNLMEATIQDLAEERISPQRANAMTNAGGKMLKAAEMQERWGRRNEHGVRAFPLAAPPETDQE